MNKMLKIIFIPLDNRPVSYTLPQQLADLNNNTKIFMPPRELLGNLTRNSDIDKILEWIENILSRQKAEYIVISLDTIAYGGLIPSRRTTDSADFIINRLNKFKNIIKQSNSQAKIYAFSSIMRISDSYVNEEEKEYWDRFGKEIFKYSYLKHKIDTNKAGFVQQKEFNELKHTIPEEILSDYLITRERNFSVNRSYIKWIEDGFLDFMVFSKDDTGAFGINIQEAEALDAEIHHKRLSDKCIVHTGADEIPSDLTAKSIVDNYGKKINIFPVFSTENGKNIISRYEDKTILDSVLGQIKLCGGNTVDSAKKADMLLLVNTPYNVQNDHCLNIHEEPENKMAVDFCINFIKDSEKPLIIADIVAANGGDNLLVMKILDKYMDLNKIYAYAGWNTTGNTVGSAISIGISRFVAEKTNNFELNNFKKLLLVRLSDDWAYQTVVRQKLRAITSFADVQTLEEEFVPLVLNISKKLDYSLAQNDLTVSFPWHRTFEVEVSV